MSRIVTISFTPLDAPGGVPKFNRDLHSAFPDRECVHFCWEEFFRGTDLAHQPHIPEWERARILNHWLVGRKHVTADDVIIADGFWAEGLEHLPKAISHSHGIWSHLTKDDVDAGKEPDMPFHHTAQVTFRKKWTRLGKPLTAVSEFIAEQMRLQWGFESKVINNGVDTDLFRPLAPGDCSTERFEVRKRIQRDRRIVVHGVNDKGNVNKGWDHIQHLLDADYAEVLSLDELAQKFSLPKNEALAQADVMVHPSAYEGNSMFVAETMACGVPIVGYDVGFLYSVKDNGFIGQILPRKDRSPALTSWATAKLLSHVPGRYFCSAVVRRVACQDLSIEKFRANWRAYVEEIER